MKRLMEGRNARILISSAKTNRVLKGNSFFRLLSAIDGGSGAKCLVGRDLCMQKGERARAENVSFRRRRSRFMRSRFPAVYYYTFYQTLNREIEEGLSRK